ncbi:hypothetical protein Pcinc_002053 [Petrolisthes cinctipes]|uniref:Grh/CP2 DB domain-containing protein n=1 Tax=Petrolisthes cinctipes TaxID=88211 RepID=A0AAE1GQP5_PETCI|nr:hypothetical protein Pcinc_002053 [Petrolisthes cinctipes]
MQLLSLIGDPCCVLEITPRGVVVHAGAWEGRGRPNRNSGGGSSGLEKVLGSSRFPCGRLVEKFYITTTDRFPKSDTKNSVGLVGCIEEIAHNAIVVYWNPLEAGAKINVAIQCLSTDFSSQKGVKGLPLHIQVDTYEDPRDAATLIHRGYCQIKVFCDKGAERKTRDEERRQAKRRMAATTRKKYEDLYHLPCDRSEFYSMADITKPPVLFTPAEDLDKVPMELQGFYSHDSENGGCSVGVAGAVGVDCSPPSNLSPQHGFPTTPGRCMSPPPHSLDPPPPPPPLPPPPPPPPSSTILSTTTTITQLAPLQVPPPTAVSPKANSSSYKFHYSFPQPYGDTQRKELCGAGLPNGSMDSPMTDVFSHVSKRSRLTPPPAERLMLYVRQEGEDVYTPLHLVPPSTVGLRTAIEEKYKIPTQTIKNIYRKNKVGVMAKVDDDMLRHYCNEDLFLMEVQHRDADSYDLTLIELTGPARNHTIVPRQYNTFFTSLSALPPPPISSFPSPVNSFPPSINSLQPSISPLHRLSAPSTIYQPTPAPISSLQHLSAHSTTCQPPPPSTSPLQHLPAHSSTCQLLFTRCQQP